jgi:uncharacterized protein (DUF1501 family)
MTVGRQVADWQRRDFVRVGAAGLFGSVFGLPQFLANAGEAKSDMSLVVVFLKGGLSTIDTWDLKPDAPAEFRGDFRPIATNVPGIQIGEHMPRIAQQMDKFSIIRSFGHNDSNHGPADHYMLTGYHPVAGFNAGLSPNNQRPAHGSIIAKKLGPRNSIPPYVCLPDMHPSGGSAYLGPNAAPFTVNGDPNDPGFAVRDIVPSLDLDASRLNSRKALLAKVDQFQSRAESDANADAKTIKVFREKAFSMMASPAVKRAFDIHSEDAKLRDHYGRTSLGQSCLMARRLVEAGVRCVTVNHVDWDTHDNNFVSLKRDLLPQLDMAMSAFLEDLASRGLLERTMVVVTGEFGRTPRINKNAGRDHWGPGFSVAIAGGGVQGGRIIGKSDERAEKPADTPHGPEDLAATIHHQMGIRPEDEFLTPEGRPVKIVNDGKVIYDLF